MLLKIMDTPRHVKLFRNGRNQAIRIPREFELAGQEALLRREGNHLIIEPLPSSSFSTLVLFLQTLAPIEDHIGHIADALPEPVEL
jgi:antitoxin VapB